MRNKTKAYITAVTAFFMLSLALVSIAAAAGSITLTPTAQAPGAPSPLQGQALGQQKLWA